MARRRRKISTACALGSDEAGTARTRRGAVCGPALSKKNRVQLCMKANPGKTLRGQFDVCELLRDAKHADRESFYAIHLNTRHEVVGIEEVAKGTVDGVEVHPRETFKSAILSNAKAIIVAHNHPSGNPNPSRQDIELTGRLIDAGKLLGMPVLDHVIVSFNGCTSLRNNTTTGLMFEGASLRPGRFVRRRR